MTRAQTDREGCMQCQYIQEHFRDITKEMSEIVQRARDLQMKLPKTCEAWDILEEVLHGPRD